MLGFFVGNWTDWRMIKTVDLSPAKSQQNRGVCRNEELGVSSLAIRTKDFEQFKLTPW